MDYDGYVKEVDRKIGGLVNNEETEIVVYLFNDGWSVKDCVNHIRSVRDFNKKLNKEN